MACCIYPTSSTTVLILNIQFFHMYSIFIEIDTFYTFSSQGWKKYLFQASVSSFFSIQMICNIGCEKTLYHHQKEVLYSYITYNQKYKLHAHSQIKFLRLLFYIFGKDYTSFPCKYPLGNVLLL